MPACSTCWSRCVPRPASRARVPRTTKIVGRCTPRRVDRLGTDETESAPAVERRFLGVIEIDSGTLLLGDPLYCLPDRAHGRAGIDYAVVVAAPNEPGAFLDG